ncbi:MAG: type II toxin-antitoxin system RelE/ParE family toxin [Calditrichaeota bacterium]|nr:type II toxin-antitoxin system RelE/ParE family toxin [Calditrichota bacterium]
MTYNIIVLRKAAKDLRNAPDHILKRVAKKFTLLETDPLPEVCKKLIDVEDMYRFRVGDWRILYSIDKANLEVRPACYAPKRRL